jgi:CheY-like chemotaxis protein
MPDMDGFGLVKRLRVDAGLSDTPVLLLTPSNNQTYLEMAQSLGAAGCLTKPCAATRDLNGLVQHALSASSSEASLAREHAGPVAANTTALHVLLAEDDEINRLVASRLLQRMGHTVVAVENGREALAALEQQRFDLVLMDVHMPEMDGLEASEKIRAGEQDSGNHVPIVALTAFAVAADRERCSRAGMDAYVTKPLQEPELVGTIERLVSRTVTHECLLSQESTLSQVLDREALRANVGGNPGALLDLVTRFLGESRTSLEELRHGITRGDAPTLEQAARRLKTSLREVAATAARAAALRLEAVARVGDVAQAADVMFALEDELTRLEPQLTSFRNDR